MRTDRKVLNYVQAAKKAKTWHKQRKIVALTSGCYDLLHLGHVKHLEYCKSQADFLIVSLGNDKTVSLLKGKGRPIFTEKARASMIAALEAVDMVVISREFGKIDYVELIELIKPNILVVNQTDSHLAEKRALIAKTGGVLKAARRVAPNLKGISTTSIEAKIKRL